LPFDRELAVGVWQRLFYGAIDGCAGNRLRKRGRNRVVTIAIIAVV
jgi:hypothetical protein